MEVLRKSSLSVEARHIVEWPKAPSTAFLVTVSEGKETEANERSRLDEGQDILEEQSTRQSASIKEEFFPASKISIHNDINQAQVTKAPTTQPSERRWLNLGRLTLKTPSWPHPQLSTGTQCNRMGNKKCWESIGPAQELFAQISQNITDLLDARVEDIEEGEPIAGNILTFGMYMIGRDQATARPTLLFTCRRPKPRRRAIRFVKESEILKGYPKVLLAESSNMPMTLGGNYLRLLAGRHHASLGLSSRSWIPKRNTTMVPPTTAATISSRSLVGIIAGSLVGGVLVVLLIKWYLCRWMTWRRRKPVNPSLKEARNFHVPQSSPPSVSTNFAAQTVATNEALVPRSSPLYVEKNKKDMAEVQGQLLPNMMNSVVPEHANRPRTLAITPKPFAVIIAGNHLDTGSGAQPKTDSPSMSLSGSILHISEGEEHPQQDSFPRFPPLSPPHASNLAKSLTDSAGWYINPDTGCHQYPLEGTENATREVSLEANGLKICPKERLNPPIPCTALYGMPIFGGDDMKQGTIGGILVSQDVYYGLTVSHLFSGAQGDASGGSLDCIDTEGSDTEFAIDSDDEESTTELGISDLAITTSISSTASVSRISSTTSGNSRTDATKMPLVSNPENANKRANTTTGRIRNNSAKSTHIARPSVQSTLLGHDWALVELSETSVFETEQAVSKNEDLQDLVIRRRIAAKPTTDTEIVAIKGYSGVSRGILSPSATRMKLTPSSKFHEVWTVRFDGPLARGDSGSWVLDSVSGDLYGHIVAGIAESGIAFILPAQKTFQEIEEVIGPVELLSTTLPRKKPEGKKMKERQVNSAGKRSVHDEI